MIAAVVNLAAAANLHGHTFLAESATALASKAKGAINPWWELLDCQSTCDVYCNPHLLRNIQRIGHSITIHSNAGRSTTDLIGKAEHGWVWYDPAGIANILSLKRMSRKHRITYDS